MKQNTSKVVAIKCSTSNAIHKILNPVPCKTLEAWRHMKNLTKEEKVALFDKIVMVDRQKSSELSNHRFNLREKKRVNKLRIAKNKQSKRKTSKSEWEAMQNEIKTAA